MFNVFVRASLVHVLIPMYAMLLSVRIGHKIQLIVRNSASSSRDYSAFLSDIDLAALAELSDAQLTTLRSCHERLQKIFLFLGELEIYTPSEWQKRNQLLEQLEPFYTPLRLLRKIRWMIRYIDNSSMLAGLRAKRGLLKALHKLGIDQINPNDLRQGRNEIIEKPIHDLISKMKSSWNLNLDSTDQVFKIRHFWLELFLIDKSSTAPDENSFIICSDDEAYLLAAIFPQRIYQSADQSRLDELRKIPKVREFLTAFALHEYLVMTASVRGMKRYPEWYTANLADLEYWIKNY